MSGSIRLYLDASLQEGGSAMLSPRQAHYLGTVMRRATGSAVQVFNPRDGEFAASIAGLNRQGGVLAIGAQSRAPAPEVAMALAFALLKRDATDLVVEKATELGVTEIFPLVTERTQASHVNLERLAAIAIEAAEQCERLGVPVVHPPQKLPRFLATWPAGSRLAAAIERSGAPAPAPGVAGLLVGPEGGFTPLELDVIGRHPFVVPAGLGPRVLRAETAAIAGLALIAARQ